MNHIFKILFSLIGMIFLLGCGSHSIPIYRSVDLSGSDINSTCNETNSSQSDMNSTENDVNLHKQKKVEEPLYQEQWAIHYDKPFYDAYDIDKEAHIHLGEYDKKYSGKKIKIAIIDSGFDVEQIEFKRNIIAQYNARDGSFDVESDDIEDCSHGTAVTGIIASNINEKGLRGLAPNVEIVFIKLDLGGFLDDKDFIDAFELAEKSNVDVINCSWGTGDVSDVVKSKINELASTGREGKGILILFAAGNDGNEIENDESAINSVVGVGSTDEENLRAIYSSFGKGLDIVAPGGYTLGITTTHENNKYITAESQQPFMGTSASTPIVSSLVCLMLEANPNLTRKEIQDIVSLGADKIGNAPYLGGKNIYYGNGKVNFEKSLKIVETLR